jgi:predicted ATP-dependent endonuclease of OLD family
MKIRKIHIKNYKMFKDVTIDFTNSNGETLDTIVIAGINGSGKTTLLQLLQKLFSERLNLFKVQSILHKYEEDENALLCDEIKLELDVSNEEKYHLVSLADRFRSKVNKFMEHQEKELLSSFKQWKLLFENTGNYIDLSFKLSKEQRDFIIKQNDFQLFGILPEDELQSVFKVLYFPAVVYGDIKKTKPQNTLDIFNKKSPNDNLNSDGIVFSIDILFHGRTVETHIVRSVQEKLIVNRDLTAREVIEPAIDDINQLLKGISLKTKLVDINPAQPVFKSFSGINIGSNELSGGEKQLYYRAILFDKLRPQNSLILVDEPETSLHPTWQQEVLKLYKNIPGNNQVILATHSPHIIASTHPDNLFILQVNEEKKTVECFNAKKDKGLYIRGSEPNDILDEVMGTPLRDNEIQKKIDELSDWLRLHPEDCDTPKMQKFIGELTNNLGRKDPFIMRLNHQLMMLKRRKQNQPA